MKPLHLSKINFDDTLAKNETVLVDFYADWCGPCKMLAPIVEQIAEENSDIVVAKVNVDHEPDLAGRYGVMSIPTVIVFKNGQISDTSVGLAPKAKLLNMTK